MVACSDFTPPPLHIQGMIQLPLSATKKLYRNNNHSRADHRIDHEFADRSVATGNAEFHQQIRQTDVFHRQKLSCSCHAQCTGQIGLAAAGSPPAGSHCGAHGCSCRSRGGAVLPSSASCLADTPHSPDKLQGRRRLPAGSGAANGCSFVHSILRQQ